MLKHATISRTSRAQQTLQLQRHWLQQDQQQQQPELELNQDQSKDSTLCNDSTDDQSQQVLLNDSCNQSLNCTDDISLNDVEIDRPHNERDEFCIQNQSSASLLSPTLSSQMLLQRQLPSSCCSSPAPKNFITNLQPVASKYSPVESRSTPPSLSNSPMKITSSKYTSGPKSLSTSSTTTRTTNNPDSMIKIFAQTLSQDIEYITLPVNTQTKSQQIVKCLLKKFRLKHRDPNLFYLTLERWIRKDGLRFKSVMLLGDEACPLQLQQCCSNPPHDDIKFTLQMRTGALVKVYCSDVVPDAKYKCLSLSTQTTVEETIELMLYCLNISSQNRINQNTKTHISSTANTIISPGDTHHQHDHMRHSNSPNSSDSSTSSSSDTSSSSGIESEPLNNNLINDHIALNSDSRASSVTSISSSSNFSSISGSVIDQFCMVIECRESAFKRVLDSDEYLVDVYQNLLEEASRTESVYRESSVNERVTQNSSSSDTMRCQNPDQWFFIKLKRRQDSESNHHGTQGATMDSINTRRNIPLPLIPPALFKHESYQHRARACLRNTISETQIESNHESESGSAEQNSAEIELMRDIIRSTPKTISQSRLGRDVVDSAGIYRQPPPPPIIVLTPPIRPRRRNLSNVSSTFGRPLTSSNRRRYDPAQLAEDLDKLNITSLATQELGSGGHC